MSANTKDEVKRITVAELRERLSVFADEDELDFSGLSFYRLKKRGDRLVQVEFNEAISRSPDGRWTIQEL